MTIARAHAKVTLALHVTGVRADGMHELDALVVCVDDLFDVLDIDLATMANSIECVVTPTGSAPEDASNLAVRAAHALGVSARLRIDKRIPSEAGLGGGSADAAAVLRMLGANRSAVDRDRIAARLGSDVPVCLTRRPTRMRGVGEVLDALDAPSVVHMVVATPMFGCSTPAVYRAWDALGAPRSERVIAAPAGWDRYGFEFRNDLEPAALVVEERLRVFRDEFERVVGTAAMLCGSGSSYCAWFATREAANAAAGALHESSLECRAIAAVSSL